MMSAAALGSHQASDLFQRCGGIIIYLILVHLVLEFHQTIMEEINYEAGLTTDTSFDILTGHLFACGTPFINTFIKVENLKGDLERVRIAADDLFSMFTANIMQQSTLFTR